MKERAYFTGILRRVFREFPDDYQIVISLGYPNTTIEPLQSGNLTVYNWIPNRFEYLKACDVVVSRAGHGTLTQSISYGKPLILVPTPNHPEQLNNARVAAKMGVAKVIEQKNLNKETLLEAVRKTLEHDQFRERSEQIQRDVLTLDGMEIALQTITEVAESFGKNTIK